MYASTKLFGLRLKFDFFILFNNFNNVFSSCTIGCHEKLDSYKEHDNYINNYNIKYEHIKRLFTSFRHSFSRDLFKLYARLSSLDTII